MQADLDEIADDGLRELALPVGVEVELEAAGKARLRQQGLGLGGIVGVLGHVGGARELVGVAGGVDHFRGRADQVLGDGLAVDGVRDRLAHALVGEELLPRGAQHVERQIGDAQRLGVLDHDGRVGLDALGLVLGHVPQPVDRARHQLGRARVAVLDGAELDLGDLGVALEAVFEVGGVPLHHDVVAGLHLGDLVGAGAVGLDRAEVLLAVGLHRRAVVVPLLHDEAEAGEVGQRRREGPVEVDANLGRRRSSPRS